MTTGIQINGTDLDSLFEPYHAGAKVATTGIQAAGTDICNRYQAVTAGNGTAYGTTGRQTNGTDIGTLFVKLGTYASLSASASPAQLFKVSSGLAISGTMTTATTTVTASGGSGGYSHSWSVINISGISNAQANPSGATCSMTGTVTNTSGTGTQGTATLRDTVTSAGSTVNVDISVSLTYTHTASCVVTGSYLSSGIRAGKTRQGQLLRVTDPQMPSHNSVEAVIRRAEKHTAQCVRITTANGAWLECSVTAPIPVKDGSFVNAPDLLGLQIPTTEAPNSDTGHVDIEWSEVVNVKRIGRRRVQLIFVDNRCFWASGNGRRFILHHNAKPIAIP